MIEFFTLSWSTHIFITLILGLCVLAQTLALVLNFFSNELARNRSFKNLLELSILFEIFVLSLLYGQMVNAYKNGFVVPSGYENIRIFTFLVILILVVIVCIFDRTLLPFRVIPLTIVSLPVIENLTGRAFPWIFVISLIFFMIRSIKICVFSIIAIRTSISALSVIHAIDTLHTGVLFSENDGHILLSNYQMQNLMIAFTGKIFRNSIDFCEMLLSDEYESRYKKTELDGQTIYLLPDTSAWMFTKTNISFRMKNYIHISVADVSELWTLTDKLQTQDRELRHKSEEIKKTIANLHILSKEKEIDKAKMRAHDILGQRLSVLLRLVQNEDDLDYDLLKSLSEDLLRELKSEDNEISADHELKNIQEIFDAIGVEIELDGSLPDDIKQAYLFVDIIRESSTNAVRHGFATQINIKTELIDNEYKLTVSNNGHTTINPITPGSGIRVMRKKVSAYGGNLEIAHHPVFTLSVVLPGGDNNG